MLRPCLIKTIVPTWNVNLRHISERSRRQCSLAQARQGIGLDIGATAVVLTLERLNLEFLPPGSEKSLLRWRS